ncbi:hypothetical protein MM236_16555 [Belliella sp. DSM 107340]|uniref:Viral A-type inclusion protein n=1 Tax=Belliella calami TaxID=2923436 RepID=A0ABS9UTT9_9BACT|nr:hypothetical protein [Belliella calami]MCH7399610.1 hypothetical protein [Belliella calami]
MMRFNIVIVSVVSFLILTFSCQSEKVDENELLREEVIAIHDEVMPHMGELKALRKKIDAKANSLESDSPEVNSEKVKELRVLAVELDEAFDGMFVWMRQFKNSYEDMSEEAIHAYLLNQKELVKKVNNDINVSMKKANEELKKSDQ